MTLTLSCGTDPDDENLPRHPFDEAREQAAETERMLNREANDFLHFPWSALDDVVGGIGEGEIWFVGAYSGHGKTTFLMSMVDALFVQGKRVFYMGLESKPNVLRTQWACQRLGLDAGDVLSGAMTTRHDWQMTRARLVKEVNSLCADARSNQIYFSPMRFVDARKLKDAVEQAKSLESDVLVIDHVDHLEGSAKNLYESSVQIQKVLLDAAQKYGIRVLAATQFNNEMIKGDRLGMHRPPTPNAVYMGSHKRMIASGMLGLYKPFKIDITKEETSAFARGELEPQQVVEPGVMAVSLMKHRLFSREGRIVKLRVERGKVGDLAERDLYRTRDEDGFRVDP